MSQQAARTRIIQENLPILIKQLSGEPNNSEEQRHFVNLAKSIIRNYRTISTNSHDVRRYIEAIQEKFTVHNSSEYSDYLGELCDVIIHHPLCVHHYEIDVQWSLIDFLLRLAYNPTRALRSNKDKIDANRLWNIEMAQADTDDLANKLREDFIPLEKYSDSDPEPSPESDCLSKSKTDCESDYESDSEPDYEAESNTKVNTENRQLVLCGAFKENNQIVVPKSRWKTKAQPEFPLPGIRPPAKPRCFYPFDWKNAMSRLCMSVQHTWWLSGENSKQALVRSDNIIANFTTAYNRHITETTNHRLRARDPIVITEECLLREIIWMFHSPQQCIFFDVSDTSIKIRNNVSIPTVTVRGIGSFLFNEILPYIVNMHRLRKFIKSIYNNHEFTPSKTIECYAASLNVLLEPIYQQLLEYELLVIEQRDDETITLINMRNKLRHTHKMLEYIEEIHMQVVTDLKTTPPHVSSAYLLAKLMCCYRSAFNGTEANLAISLFMTSIKVYCAIIDTWWTLGCLEDCRQEFIIERVGDAAQIYVRPYSTDSGKGSFIPAEVTKVIHKDACFNLLLSHSLEAGNTLNLLYDIDRMSDLRNVYDTMDTKLYNVFINEVMLNVVTLQSVCTTSNNVPFVPMDQKCSGTAAPNTMTAAGKIPLINNFTTVDEFLLVAISMDSEEACDTKQQVMSNIADDLSAFEIFEQFESTLGILPLEHVILDTLKRILDTRIGFVNSFVMQMYKNGFEISQQFGVIRKVLLLEASDLMHHFYSNLFEQIELGNDWVNPFALSLQLEDLVCAKLPGNFKVKFYFHMHSFFRCRSKKVVDAVDELVVKCHFSREISHIIKPEHVEMYNEVFRFLLKVKWGLISLENMRFSRSSKRRRPFAPYEVIDLLMRRLEQLRFWMLFAVQTINFHLMTHVLQAMGEQLDKKIANCSDLKEMELVHMSYLNTICEHCFLRGEVCNTIKMGVEQLLNLILILRLEWDSCTKYIDSKRNPLAIDDDDSFNSTDSRDPDNEYLLNSQVHAIEMTYIRCHQYLANKLNNEVYLQHNTFLSGLRDAFNTSMPY